MSVNIRIAGIAAAGAFLVSALIGLIAGVVFATLLVRAIISAILFGFGVFVGRALLERYTPELLSLSEDESVAGNVDISVGDEEEDVFDGDNASAREASPSSEQAGRRGYFDESLVEEVEEVPADPETAGSSTEDQGIGSSFETSDSEPDEENVAGSLDNEGDSLPELQNFSGTFDSLDDGAVEGNARGAPEREQSESGAELDSLDGDSGSESSGNDPKVMADAIRTVLKREG